MNIYYNILFLFLAFIIDLAIADPHSWPHPVKFMGSYIIKFENISGVFDQKEDRKRLLGLVLVISLLGLTFLISLVLLVISYRISFLVFAIIYIYLSYSCISIKGMADEAKAVVGAYKGQGLEPARKQLSRIVGRTTDELTIEEVYAAAIETTAENTSDGAIAPLFYLILFGPIGGLLYKAINTMDSMVAYLTPKYKSFGYYPAILDDIANYIPARLSAIFIILAGYLLGLDSKRAVEITKRDGRKHLSPNSGYSEAAVAGLLGIRLGGSHSYNGVIIKKPTIGDDLNKIDKEALAYSVKILYLSSSIFLLVSLGIKFLLFQTIL